MLGTVSVGAPTWRGLKHLDSFVGVFFAGVSRCPDMEGIETTPAVNSNLDDLVSVGAPTWRGLKPAGSLVQLRLRSISRCPDMEGIETSSVRRRPHPQFRISRCPDMEGIETPDVFQPETR